MLSFSNLRCSAQVVKMAGKRRRSSSSRSSKKIRRFAMYRPRKNFRNGGQGFIKTSRTFEASPIVVGATDTIGAYEFKLNNLPNYADFDIFDEYKITGVKVMFVPGFADHSELDALGVAYVNMPTLITAIDYDDATAVTKDALLSNESVIIHTPGQKVMRYFQPKISKTYWQSAVSTGFGSSRPEWIDTQSSPAVSHYGLKWVCSPGTALANGMRVRVFIKMYLQFRKVT